MPRDVAVRRQRMQRVAGETRLPREAGQHGHLAIGGDPAARNAADDMPDTRMRVARHGAGTGVMRAICSKLSLADTVSMRTRPLALARSMSLWRNAGTNTRRPASSAACSACGDVNGLSQYSRSVTPRMS